MFLYNYETVCFATQPSTRTVHTGLSFHHISVEEDGCQSLKRTQVSVLFGLDSVQVFPSFVSNMSFVFDKIWSIKNKKISC